MSENYRVGILGGMGPEAGVLLQQLIIKATPAKKDQDHIEVLTYTNPKIPDRTKSLKEDGGTSYLNAVAESLNLLENAGVDILVIACNTAYARISEIIKRIKTPIINIVELARMEIVLSDGLVGILATDGTINNGLFSIPEQPDKIITPRGDIQREVMEVIYEIKKNGSSKIIMEKMEKIVREMQFAGCKKIVLGCTELSIYNDELTKIFGDIFIDSLRLAAKELVKQTLKTC